MRDEAAGAATVEAMPRDRAASGSPTGSSTEAAGQAEVKPFYMWAGGKGRLLKQYRPHWPDPESYTGYVEPFFGGGAVYAWIHSGTMQPPSVVGDVNAELMGVLRHVRDDPEGFLSDVGTHVETYLAQPVDKASRKEWYYELRKGYWAAPDPATLYVLMRLGFNGIWQTCVESKGLFGTPAGLLGHTRSDQVVDPGNIRAWSRTLQGTKIHTGSYETVPVPAERSLLYLDPPYRGSFTTYGTGFGDTEQEELARWARERCGEGHLVVLANRCVEGDTFFEDLLPEATFHYFDVTYTAGRRKREEDGGFTAKSAREFIAVLDEAER